MIKKDRQKHWNIQRMLGQKFMGLSMLFWNTRFNVGAGFVKSNKKTTSKPNSNQDKNKEKHLKWNRIQGKASMIRIHFDIMFSKQFQRKEEI